MQLGSVQEALGMGCFLGRFLGQKKRQARIGGGEGVSVNLAHAAAVKILAAEIAARFQRHVTAGTVGLGLRWIVEAARADARNATQQVGVVVVLTAQEFFVVVQLNGDADLVANRAELCAAVEWLEERL